MRGEQRGREESMPYDRPHHFISKRPVPSVTPTPDGRPCNPLRRSRQWPAQPSPSGRLGRDPLRVERRGARSRESGSGFIRNAYSQEQMSAMTARPSADLARARGLVPIPRARRHAPRRRPAGLSRSGSAGSIPKRSIFPLAGLHRINKPNP